MRLKRDERLWLRADENSPWLPLAAGVFRRQSSVKWEKCRFFAVGAEEKPQEEVGGAVKLLTLLFHRREGDEGQELLLHSLGKPLLLKQENESKNGEIKGYSAVCAVDSVEETEGSAAEPLTYRICLRISQEMPIDVKE